MADFDPDAYLADDKPLGSDKPPSGFNPDSYLGSKSEASAKPPEMFLSEPDASGRRYAVPSTDYNEPEKPVGVLQRAKEGLASAYEEPLGFSPESMKRYPWLGWLQQHVPAITAADAIMRVPGSIWGGVSGAVSGAAEPVIGSAQANRLQRDLHSLPQAAAGEMPMAAPKMLPAREAAPLVEREARAPPPLPAEAFPDTPRQVVRPDVGVDLLQPDIPHSLPPERSALSAAGQGGPLSDISPETISHLRSVMEEQGFTPHTIDQRLAEMSAHHFLGEITPSLEADMGAIAAPPGPGKLEVIGSLRQRGVEARERVQHEFDRAFGANENVAKLTRIMEGDRDRASDPFYQRFRETVVTPTPAVESLMPRLQASGALQAANRALAVEGIPPTFGFFEEQARQGNIRGVPTATAFQYAKEFLDARIEEALAAPGGRNDARRYTQLRNDLVNALDNHPNVGNIWREARNTYAQPSEILDAMRLGQRVLTEHIGADELPFLTAAYSDAQMRGLRVGMRAYLEQVLGKKDNLTAEVLNKTLSPNNIQKVRWAIGDEATDQLVTAMEHERHMHTAPTRVHGGSPTALRLEANKRWTVQPGMLDKVGLSDVAGAVSHPVRTAAGVAEKFGLSQRKAAKEAKMARLREESSRIFTLQGPERDAVARYLVGGQEANQPIDLASRRQMMRSGFASGGAAKHNHNPSEAQKKAGNYAKTHKSFHGLDISIENVKGSKRSGVSKNGKEWSVRMPASYGYIKGTVGADKDHVDCYLGPNERSDQVFVVDQMDHKTGRFDEHKVLLGFNSEREAKDTYLAGFSDGKNRIKHIRRMTVDEFKAWLRQGNTSKPIKAQDAGLRIAYRVKAGA